MPLTPEFKKRLKSIGHQLHPLVRVADKGLTENVLTEAERALHDHELIKIQVNSADRAERQALLQQLATHLQAELVQSVGKIGLFYRAAPKPNPKLSNLLRFA